MTARAVHLSISGRVQGVGFRAFVEREALALSVSGWVRNRPDGSVEAVASGDAAAVAAFVAACRRGPRGAVVQSIDETDYAGPLSEGFEVLPTA